MLVQIIMALHVSFHVFLVQYLFTLGEGKTGVGYCTSLPFAFRVISPLASHEVELGTK